MSTPRFAGTAVRTSLIGSLTLSHPLPMRWSSQIHRRMHDTHLNTNQGAFFDATNVKQSATLD
jgi:hypothetical protein